MNNTVEVDPKVIQWWILIFATRGRDQPTYSNVLVKSLVQDRPTGQLFSRVLAKWPSLLEGTGPEIMRILKRTNRWENATNVGNVVRWNPPSLDSFVRFFASQIARFVVGTAFRTSAIIVICCLLEYPAGAARWWCGTEYVDKHLIILRRLAKGSSPPQKSLSVCIVGKNVDLMEHCFYVSC